MTATADCSIAATLQTYCCTFGTYTQTVWTDRRNLSWPELTEKLTRHEVGPKEGPSIVPATFRGTRRHKADADQIDVVALDSDCGHTLEEIEAAIRRCRWAAIIHSTHSHLTTSTTVKRTAWDKFNKPCPKGAAHLFLIDKGYLPRVADGACVSDVTDTEVTIKHAPCPKFRIVLRLARPWRAVDFSDQNSANEAWKERIEALAEALGLSHDQSCTDTSRLFYLPRYPGDGRTPVARVIEGADCDIWALPSPEKAPQSSGLFGTGPAIIADTGEFTDPETGEIIDLRQWAKAHGKRFEIVKALKARTPDVFVGYVADAARHHIRCVNEDAHTTAGTDRASFVVNASEANNEGFVYHCRHAHCDGKDRLLFLRLILEQGWLKVADLTNPKFLTVEANAPEAGGKHTQASQQSAERAKIGLPAYTLGELLDDASPMPDDLITPRLLTPGGLLVLAGAPKVGKSDFLIHLLVHAAAGVPFLRFTPPRSLRVFYLQAEIQYHYLRERLRGMQLDAATRAGARDNLLVTPKLRILLDEKGVAAAAAVIRARFGDQPPDIICVDPIRNVFDGGPSGEGENSNTAMLFFLQARIEALRDVVAPECGLILCHHTKKMSKRELAEDPFMALSGASALRSFYTSGLVMYRPDEKRPERELHIELRNGPGFEPMIIDKVGGRWVELDRSGERLVRRDFGERLDAERRRKHDVILQLIYDEARGSKLYTGLHFAEEFENHAGLGSMHTIRERIGVLATKGYIKFVRDARPFGHPPSRSPFGYLCVEGMQFGPPVETVSPDTGEVETTMQGVLPSHYKCSQTGTCLPVENPNVWVYADGESQA